MADSDAPTLPAELPVLPLRRTVAFPLTLQPLAVSRPVSVESVNAALGADRLVLLLLQKGEGDEPGAADLHRVGTIGVIRQMAKAPGGLNVIIEGVARVHADEITHTGTTRSHATPMPT
jgi:ATP-dependent Lon protease